MRPSGLEQRRSEGLGLSVAVCTYNGAAYLHEQLDSIIAQSRPADEIIICDDGSRDDTWPILEKYWQRFPEVIRIYRNDTNLGPAKNFGRAVGLCTKDLIALGDQDDVWHPEKLKKLEQRFIADPTLGLVFCNAERIDSTGNPLEGDLWQTVGFDARLKAAVKRGNGLQALLQRSFVTGCTIMFRATLKEKCLPFVDSSVHDYWISLVSAATSRIDFVDEKLVGYRQHSANVIGAQNLSVKERFDEACRLGIQGCIRDKNTIGELENRLSTLEESQLALVRQKRDYLRFRIALWSKEVSRTRKAALIARNVAQGSYRRCSHPSWNPLVKDVLMVLGMVGKFSAFAGDY